MDSEKLIAFKNSGIQGFRSFCQNNESAECKVGIFLHSVYSNDESSFRLARECLRECAGFISIHVSEDMATARLESERYCMSAVELLDSYGLLSKKAILVHCGCCSDSDLMLIKERGALICVCPISNSFLNTKTVDLYKLDTIGIPWCITTDGLATGRTFSLLEQIRFVRALYPQIPLSRYWESITTVPAKYFGMPLYTGTVREGVKSTFLLTNYRGTDPSELIANLIEGEIEFKPIKL
jgi:cytosine/adenosine deaminase-related metal-dependent hydrolase